MQLELLREFKDGNSISGLIANNAEPWYRGLGINVPVSMASIGMVLAAFSVSGDTERALTAEAIMISVALIGVALRAFANPKLAVPSMRNFHWQLGVVCPLVCATIVMLVGLFLVSSTA